MAAVVLVLMRQPWPSSMKFARAPCSRMSHLQSQPHSLPQVHQPPCIVCDVCVCSVCTAALISRVLLAALTEQCLSAGQCELASRVMASLPQLLGRLVFASASYPSLQRLAVSCGLTFRNVLKVVMLICVSAFQISVRSFAFFKVMCNMGRTATESVENLWRRLRLRVCLTLALCIARRVFGIFGCSSRLRSQDF